MDPTQVVVPKRLREGDEDGGSPSAKKSKIDGGAVAGGSSSSSSSSAGANGHVGNGGAPEESLEAYKAKKINKVTVEALGRTGGTYIPPFMRARLE